MNWDAIGAVGEVGGAIAVVASVLYLAVQVRAAGREARATSVHSLQDAMNQWLSTGADREVATLWLQGLNDFESLEPVERVQFNALIQVPFRITEDAFAQHGLGRLPPETWTALEKMMSGIAAAPGAKAWWRTRAHVFTPGFQGWVEAQLEKGADPLIYRNTPVTNASPH